MSMVESKVEGKQVQQGDAQQSVETEQGTDQQAEHKQGDKQRDKKPVLGSSNQIEVYKARDRYIKRVRNKGITRAELQKYLHQDFTIKSETHKKKAESMIKSILNEYHRYRNEAMQALQDEIKAVLADREKWALNKDNELNKVYPKPIVEGNRVTDVKYEEDRAYLYPADLWEWILEQEELDYYRKLNRNRARSTGDIDDSQVRLWISYLDNGYSRRDVGDLFLISEVLIGKLVKGYLYE